MVGGRRNTSCREVEFGERARLGLAVLDGLGNKEE